MRFQLPTLGPRVRAVVMIDVAEEEASVGPVNDEPYVGAYPYRPEALVLRFVQFVEAETRRRRIHLEVEGRRLDCLLLVAGQPRETVGECVGDEERHSAGSCRSESSSMSMSSGWTQMTRPFCQVAMGLPSA